LRTRGVGVDIVTLFDRPGLTQEAIAGGARVTCVAGGGGRPGAALRVRRHLQRSRPDLVHTTLFEADLTGRVAAASLRIPVVSSLVNVAYGPEQRMTPGISRARLELARLLDAGTARLVRRFHAITEYVAEVMAARLYIPRDRIDVVPRGRDPGALGDRDVARARGARERLGVADDSPLLVSVARHEYQKGLDVLLQAVATVVTELPSLRVVVVGNSGNQTATLERIIEDNKLGNVVSLAGTRDDVPDVLAAADAFVLASRWEGQSGALLEAMAMRAPIIVSDLDVFHEVLGDGTATFFESGNANALAASICTTLSDRDAATARADAARTRFDGGYTLDASIDGMVAFIERALRR
jgi:glycosyltransferase involved in cell wall biosynthesis